MTTTEIHKIRSIMEYAMVAADGYKSLRKDWVDLRKRCNHRWPSGELAYNKATMDVCLICDWDPHA